MKALNELRLRTSVVLLQFSTIIITLAVVGTALLAFLIHEFSTDNLRYTTRASETMAQRVEVFLDDLSADVVLIGKHYEANRGSNIRDFLAAARKSRFSAIFIVGSDSALKVASLSGSNPVREAELVGVDLSAYPLLRDALASGEPTWSGKHLSAITGVVTVGFALPLRGGEAVIVEIPLETIVEVGTVFRQKNDLDFWVIDSKGEVVADTDGDRTQLMNLGDLDVVQAGFSGAEQPERMAFRGRNYTVAATFSEKIGWLFVSRVPAGLENPDLQKLLFIVLAFALGTAVFGLLLAPIWARRITRPMHTVTDLASQIAAGQRPEAWPRGAILEFNRLIDDLKAMSDAISKRELELRDLNEGLEARVEERTRELVRINDDLKAAVIEIQQAREGLIQSEKVAALGRMVAGISHELNTPLGNGRMAVSTLAARLESFRKQLSDPVDQRELQKFLDIVAMSVEIAENNLVRAGNLVRSFKEVSADRTASRRRKVVLKELMDEVALTLTPLLKSAPVTLEIDVPTSIWVDSYPGELGQIITNLVENAVVHAFQDGDAAKIVITAEQTSDDAVTIDVTDNGRGMSPEVRLRAFDPFYTTAMGKGGTGLGLYIVHRTVESVLGGAVTLESRTGWGTAFKLTIPVAAPDTETPALGANLKVG